MSEHQWPAALVDAVADMAVENQCRCGENKLKLGGSAWGCGGSLDGSEALDDPSDRYKCADCNVVFHRRCIRRHFVGSGDERHRHALYLEDTIIDLRLRLAGLDAR